MGRGSKKTFWGRGRASGGSFGADRDGVHTEDVISHHGVLAEGVSFIGKPYTPSALARKVREVIDEA